MADSAIIINTNTSVGATVDTRTNTGGEHRQVVVLGEGAATSDAVIPGDATNGLDVDVTRVQGTVTAVVTVTSVGTSDGFLSTNMSDRALRDCGKIDIAGFDVAMPAGTNWLGYIALATTSTLPTGSNVIGHVIADSGSTTIATQATGTNLHTVVDSGTVTAVTSITNALPAGTNWLGYIGLASTSTLPTGSNVIGAVTQSGTWNVGSLTSITNALPVGSNWLGYIGLATTSTLPTGSNVIGAVTQSGTWNVGTVTAVTAISNALPAGTNFMGYVNLQTVGSSFVRATKPNPAATKTDIKSSAGLLKGWYIYNANSSVAYAQLFNTTGANVTLGTTVPDLTFGIPATSAANVLSSKGIFFSAGISFAVTTTSNGSTAVTSSVDCNWFYD